MRLPPLLAVGGFGLLLLGWVVGNPPMAGPDESGHYTRALSITTDGLVGAPVEDYQAPHLDDRQLAVVAQAVRQVTLPAGLSPEGRSCFLHDTAQSVACLDDAPPPPAEPVAWVTNVGTYQPAFYILPGLVARLAQTPEVAGGLARGVNALTALVLLAAGVAAAWRPGRGGLPLLGPLAALSPMVVFTAASLNPSGPEIAAGFALAAGLLRLARDATPPAWVWAVAGAAGAALVLGRSTGPLWLALHLLVFVIWCGLGPSWRLLRAHPGRAAAAAAVVVAALVANLAFEAVHGMAVAIDARPLGPSLVSAWGFTREAATHHAVGVFGYLDVPLPRVAYWTWWGLTGGLWALAFAVGTARQRAVFAVTTGLVLAAAILLEALVLRHHGFHIQGRHLLPVLVAIPLMGGEILTQRADRLPAGLASALTAAAGLAAAGVHLLAWYTNARRAAVGVPGSWAFPLQAEWAPPGGWLPWLAVTAVAAALLAAAVLSAVAARAGQAEPPGSSREGRRRGVSLPAVSWSPRSSS